MDFGNNQFTASLWGDEAFSAVLSQRNLFDIVKIVSRDTSPPGYYFASHAWMQVFGTSEVAIRSLSFLFFLGTVVTIYFLAKFLWDKKTAVLASLLTFFNPFLFIYAFEGRMYSILAFTTTLSFYFFIRKNWFIYPFAAAAALYSHHFSIFAIFVQLIWLGVIIGKNFAKNKNLLFIYLLIFILYLPWLYPLYYQTSLVSSGFWLSKPNLNSLKELFQTFIAKDMAGDWQKVLFWLVLAGFGLRRWAKDKNIDLLILSWLVVPVAFTYLISQIKSSIFFDRYMLYTIPALSLLLASKRRFIALPILVFLLATWAYTDWRYFFSPAKKPFRQFSQMVGDTIAKDDFLINYNGKAHHLWETKYYNIPAPIYSPGGPLPFYVGTAQMTQKDVIYSLPDISRLAVVTSDEPATIEIEGFVQKQRYDVESLHLLILTSDENNKSF